MSEMPSEPIDWSILPQEWSYLREPAEKYGCVWTDDMLAQAHDHVDDDELDLFIALATRIRAQDMEVFSRWWDKYPITDFPAAARVRYLLRLIHELVPADLVPFKPRPGTRVDQYIHDLQQFGSYRLASGRMWAAMLLPNEGPDAKRAIPALRALLNDDDLRVRVEVHCALALLDGIVDSHRAAIAQIHDNPGTGTDVGFVKAACHSALDKISQSQATRDLNAFCIACITPDFDNVERLIKKVDVNAYDHNGQCALSYAIGNDHVDLVEFLLQNGAKPNQVLNKQGNFPLFAAVRRGNPAIVRSLIMHGANVHAKCTTGQTALQMALLLRDAESRTLICQALRSASAA